MDDTRNMRLHRNELATWVLVVVFAAATLGCNDVGDNSYVPGIAACGTDSSSPDSTSTFDATAEAASDISSDISVNPDSTNATGVLDSTVSDTGNQAVVPPNLGVQDTGAMSTGGQGMGQQGTGQQDAGVEQTGAEDSGAQDAGGQETGTEDAGVETGVEDAGGREAGGEDTGADAATDSTIGDSGSDAAETGTRETGGVDSGHDAADGGLVPCTTTGQTNCVQCQGTTDSPKPSTTCTPTEAAIVQYDITKGHATAAGPSPTNSCYYCLTEYACLDDSIDMGNECGDPITTGSAADCLAVISCIFSSDCAKTEVATCYCGDAGPLTTCHGNPAPGPINGACASSIAQGNGYPVSDGTDNTAQLTAKGYASGRADQIFQCAITNALCTPLCQ